MASREKIQISSDDCGSNIFPLIKGYSTWEGNFFGKFLFNYLLFELLNYFCTVTCHQKGWSWGCIGEWTPDPWYSLAHSLPCSTSPLIMTLLLHSEPQPCLCSKLSMVLSDFLHLLTSQLFAEIPGTTLKTKSIISSLHTASDLYKACDSKCRTRNC